MLSVALTFAIVVLSLNIFFISEFEIYLVYLKRTNIVIYWIFRAIFVVIENSYGINIVR